MQRNAADCSFLGCAAVLLLHVYMVGFLKLFPRASIPSFLQSLLLLGVDARKRPPFAVIISCPFFPLFSAVQIHSRGPAQGVGEGLPAQEVSKRSLSSHACLTWSGWVTRTSSPSPHSTAKRTRTKKAVDERRQAGSERIVDDPRFLTKPRASQAQQRAVAFHTCHRLCCVLPCLSPHTPSNNFLLLTLAWEVGFRCQFNSPAR